MEACSVVLGSDFDIPPYTLNSWLKHRGDVGIEDLISGASNNFALVLDWYVVS